MIWLQTIENKAKLQSENYPFSLPIVANLERLKLDSEVTFFVGENGSGKSTLIEGIAEAAGVQKIDSLDRNKTAGKLARNLRLGWKTNPHRGFFLTAEDFFGFIKQIRSQKQELAGQVEDYQNRFTGYGRDLAVGAIKGQIHQAEIRYGKLEAESHGEGFLDFFQSRLVPKGIYLMDEPEAALSPTRQLGLLSLIKEMVQENCQFIIATHSPILLAYPGALIYWFESEKIKKISFDQVEHVILTKAFLKNPENYLRRL